MLAEPHEEVEVLARLAVLNRVDQRPRLAGILGRLKCHCRSAEVLEIPRRLVLGVNGQLGAVNRAHAKRTPSINDMVRVVDGNPVLLTLLIARRIQNTTFRIQTLNRVVLGLEDANLIGVLPRGRSAAGLARSVGVHADILQPHDMSTRLARQCDRVVTHLGHLTCLGIVEGILCPHRRVLANHTVLLHKIRPCLRVDGVIHKADIVVDLSASHEEGDGRGMVVLAKEIAVNRVGLGCECQWLNVEGHVRVHILLVRAVFEQIAN